MNSEDLGGAPSREETAEPTVEQAEAASQRARLKLDSIEAMVREEKRKASAAIDEKYREIVAGARKEVTDARLAEIAAMDRMPDHPWTGMRVFRMEETRKRGWELSNKVRIEGVVETRKSVTMFPGNTADYSLPRLGDGFVRLLAKGGKPGLRFERLSTVLGKCNWSLVEGETSRPGEGRRDTKDHPNAR